MGIMTLPRPVAAYFAAEKNKDADAVALCFVADGVVRDEGQTARGLPAIKEWNAEARKKYNHTVEPLDSVLREGKIVVKARVSGNFPNSPLTLEHIFELGGDKIASLEIR